jgi:hypothetical protein
LAALEATVPTVPPMPAWAIAEDTALAALALAA